MPNPRALTADTRVGGYTIIEAVAVNNHSVVYCAHVEDTDDQVWLQEFLPIDIVGRQTDNQTVLAKRGKTKLFEEALTLFLQEARILSQIRDPYVVRIKEYTEARGTAFIAMELEHGFSLDEHLDQVGKIAERELRQLFIPLLKGLRVIHSNELLHRDINPKNIFIRDAGQPLITGFGSTQRALTVGEVGLESRVTAGYSPIEQYHEHGNIGPWTDLYAVGAVLYKCISGVPPIDAAERVTALAEGKQDPLVPAMEIGHGDYQTGILSSIDWLLQPVVNRRPASAAEVLGPLAEPAAAQPRLEERKEARVEPQSEIKFTAPKLHADPAARGAVKKSRTRSIKSWSWFIPLLFFTGIGVFAFWPQIKSLLPDRAEQSASTQANIEGTHIPLDILEQPLPADEQAPELPESLKFARTEDDTRANEYRQLENLDRSVRALLDSAQARLAKGKLITPATESALADYRAILVLDDDNVDALQGIDEITTTLVKQAKNEYAQGRLDTSEEILTGMLNAGLAVDDVTTLQRTIDESHRQEQAEEERLKNAKIAEEERLEQEKLVEEERLKRNKLAEEERLKQEKLAEEKRLKQEQDERNKQVEQLLASARRALDENASMESAGPVALSYYQQVLDIDAENEPALNGISNVARAYIELANQALAEDRFEETNRLLLFISSIDPGNDVVELLREQMRVRREAVMRAQFEAARNKQLESASTQSFEAQKENEINRVTLEQGVKAYYRGDYQTAFSMLKPLADNGNQRAQFRVGVMYLRGRGIGQDEEAGTNWIRQSFPGIQSAAAEGEAWAQADLGSLYQSGLLVAQNDHDAVRWYLLAAEQGYAGAQTNLGTMYANGRGVNLSKSEAIKWLTRAAEQGDKIAQDNLAALAAQEKQSGQISKNN